jgi:hypothetical protein
MPIATAVAAEAGPASVAANASAAAKIAVLFTSVPLLQCESKIVSQTPRGLSTKVLPPGRRRVKIFAPQAA